MSSIEIGRDDLVLVAAPSDRLARRRTPLTAAQVAELSLTSRERGSGTREVVEQALAMHGLTTAAPAVEVTTSTAVRETVRAGGAPAFLSRHAVEADLRAGTLVLVRTRDLTVSRLLRAVWVGGAEPPAGPSVTCWPSWRAPRDPARGSSRTQCHSGHAVPQWEQPRQPEETEWSGERRAPGHADA